MHRDTSPPCAGVFAMSNAAARDKPILFSGPGAWDADHWVWAIEFKKIRVTQ